MYQNRIPPGTNPPSARTLKSLVPVATKTTVNLRMEDRLGMMMMMLMMMMGRQV